MVPKGSALRALRRWWIILPAAQLAWGVLLVATWLSIVWPAPIDPDYASGEILDNTIAWSESGHLYGPIDRMPYRVFNYPPAFPAVVRMLMAADIAPLHAGRLVTLASIVLAVILVYRWLRAAGCDRAGATLVVSLLASSFPLVFFVGQVHLQWAAVGASLCGCYLLRASVSPARAAAAGSALAVACFFKQSQVVSLAIVGAWLLAYHRRALFAYTTAAGTVAALGAAAMFGTFGRAAWQHVVTYTVGTFSVDGLEASLLKHAASWTPLFLFGLWVAARDATARRDVRFWYFAGSSLWLLSAARAGAGPQYYIEWSLATLLWIGPSLSTLGRPNSGHGWLAVALVAQLVFSDTIAATKLFRQAARLRRTEASLPGLCAALPEGRPVPIDSAAIARACGRQPALHPFIMTNLAQRGLWDERPFVRELEQGRFPAVVLPFDVFDRDVRRFEHWTPTMLDAVRQHYRVAEQQGVWRVFRPSRAM